MWQEHVRREKELQAECSSPFMVNLVASYKDSAYLYMLLECIMGGELFTYMQVRSYSCQLQHASVSLSVLPCNSSLYLPASELCSCELELCMSESKACLPESELCSREFELCMSESNACLCEHELCKLESAACLPAFELCLHECQACLHRFEPAGMSVSLLVTAQVWFDCASDYHCGLQPWSFLVLSGLCNWACLLL